MNYSRTILVYADWKGLHGPQVVGEIRAQYLRNKEVFDFTYADDWLRSGHGASIDPDLMFMSGPQYVPDDRANFGVFLDSSPDRWGRTLMQRREAMKALQQGRKATMLFDADYLLGVHDASRLGGLRFKTTRDGPFLDNNIENAAPPWTTLRELEWGSLELEDPDHPAAEEGRLLTLLAPGSSLGGARPKASVIDEQGHLWIAKFPSRHDSYDVGAWEYLAATLAARCGIHVPVMKIVRFRSGYHTLLSKRFDRDQDGERLHAASAMTMLRRVDGADHLSNTSYLDLANVIMVHSDSVNEDLEQLWRRILFNVLISNTDDHLRNHMFLLNSERTSWSLAPAYDVNPVPFGTGLSLNIDHINNALSVDLVKEVAPLFRLDPGTTSRIAEDMIDAVRSWEGLAGNIGLPRREVESMRNAFREV